MTNSIHTVAVGDTGPDGAEAAISEYLWDACRDPGELARRGEELSELVRAVQNDVRSAHADAVPSSRCEDAPCCGHAACGPGLL